jgi:hypothetical protein
MRIGFGFRSDGLMTNTLKASPTSIAVAVSSWKMVQRAPL